MKKLTVFSVINGFVSAFVFSLMSDYLVSERFYENQLSAEVFVMNIVLLAVLCSAGYIFAVRKQPVVRIWGALGIEAAAFVMFVFVDFILLISGLGIHFFKVIPDDNPAAGLPLIFAWMIFMATGLVVHIITGVVFTIISAIKNRSRTDTDQSFSV